MGAIFPPPSKGGVAPGTTGLCNYYMPTNTVIGEGPHFYAADCSTLLTDCASNGVISEILAAVDLIGCTYDAGRVDNLGTCLSARFVQIDVRLNDLQNQIDNLQLGIQHAPSTNEYYGSYNGAWHVIPFLADAPSDGQDYVRRDGEWEVAQIGGGGGLDHAPSNGTYYGSRNGAWSAVPIQADAPSNNQYFARYNGAWAVVPTGAAGVRGSGSTIVGLEYRNVVGAGQNFDVTAGSCTADDGSGVISLPAQNNVNLTAIRDDLVTIPGMAWRHIFAIANASFGGARLLCSASATNPTLPGGYVKKRRIFSVTTQFTTNLERMVQRGDHFLFETPRRDADPMAIDYNANPFLTLSVPPFLVEALISVNLQSTQAGGSIWLIRSSLTPVTGTLGINNTSFNLRATATDDETQNLRIITEDRRISIGNNCFLTAHLSVQTEGWIDRRDADRIPPVEGA